MSARILAFPQRAEARRRASERKTTALVKALKSFASGEREPVNDEERALADLARCIFERARRAPRVSSQLGNHHGN